MIKMNDEKDKSLIEVFVNTIHDFINTYQMMMKVKVMMMSEIKHKSMIEVLIYGEFMTYIRGTFVINILLKWVVWIYE